MSIAMMGLLTGFAKGTAQRIGDEREEEKTLIANRLKMAALNKKKRQEEDKAKVEIAQQRDQQITTLFTGASLEQRLALLSNETLFDLAVKNLDTLKDPKKLDEFIVVNKEKIPQSWKTTQDYINSIPYKPAADAKMPEMQTREVFFSRVTPDERQIEAMASQYGEKAADLFAYENLPEARAAAVFGSVNLNALKKDKTSKERLEEANAAATQAVIEFGEETPQAKAAMDNYNKIKTLDELLNPTQAKWATYVSGLKLAMATGTPEQKAAAEAEFEREVVRIEAMSAKQKAADLPAMSTLGNILARTQLAAMRQKFGNKLDKNLRVVYAQDGSASFQYIGTDLAMQEEIRQHGLDAAASIAELYLDKDGRPLSRDMKAVLISQGYKFDSEGRMIKRAAPAAPAAPPAAPATAPAPGTATPAPGATAPAPGTATPAAPAKTEQERILEKMSKADREAKEWADANINSPKRTDKLMAEQILQNLKEKYPGIQ